MQLFEDLGLAQRVVIIEDVVLCLRACIVLRLQIAGTSTVVSTVFSSVRLRLVLLLNDLIDPEAGRPRSR